MSDERKLKALQQAKRSSRPSVFTPNVLAIPPIPSLDQSNQPVSTFPPAVIEQKVQAVIQQTNARLHYRHKQRALQHEEQEAEINLRRFKHQLRNILTTSARMPIPDNIPTSEAEEHD